MMNFWIFCSVIILNDADDFLNGILQYNILIEIIRRNVYRLNSTNCAFLRNQI